MKCFSSRYLTYDTNVISWCMLRLRYLLITAGLVLVKRPRSGSAELFFVTACITEQCVCGRVVELQ